MGTPTEQHPPMVAGDVVERGAPPKRPPLPDAARLRRLDDSAPLVAAIRGIGNDKAVARVTGFSLRQAARYRSGDALPNPFALARLMRASQAVMAVVLRMAGVDDAYMDREEARLKAELRDIQTRRRASDAERATTLAGAASCEVVGPCE